MLGGLIINKTAIAGNDANNFETGTGYRLNGGLNVAHKPSNPNRMVIYTYANDSAAGATKFQIACIADGSIAAREYDNGNWNDWSMTQSYLNAYPNLSSLASALGVIISGAEGYSGSLNSITKPSVCSFGAAATDKPFEYGVLVTFPIVGSYQAQIAFNISSGKQFASRVNGSTWHLYD